MPTRTRILLAWSFILAAALLVHLGSVPLFDADEGRNAEIGREMAATGDFVMPRIDGMPYLDKPVVYFAAEAAAMKVLGATELAARLPAALFTLLTALLIAWFARGVWGRNEAAVAVIAYLSMPFVIAFAHTVIFDSALTFFVVLAIVAFHRSIEWYASPVALSDAVVGAGSRTEEANAIAAPGGTLPIARARDARPRRSWTWPAVAWAAIGFGVITKGPVAILLPLLVAIPYAIRRRAWRALWSWGGLVAFVIVVAPWVWAVSNVVPGFLHYVLVTETAQRLATKALKRTGAPWYFVPYLIGGALPWCLVALSDRRHLHPGRRNARFFLLLWIVLPFLFFSISQSKRPQYILPIMPAVALLVAQIADEGRLARGIRAAGVALAVVGLVVVAAPHLHLRMEREIADAARSSALPLGLLAIAGGVLAFVFSRRRDVAVIALSLPIAALPIVCEPVLEAIAVHRSAKALVSALGSQPAGRRIIGWSDYTGSLQFYLRRRVDVVTPDAEEFTSNYILRHYDDFADRDGWPVHRATAALAPDALYIVRANDAVHRRALEAAGFQLLAADPRHVAYARATTMPLPRT